MRMIHFASVEPIEAISKSTKLDTKDGATEMACGKVKGVSGGEAGGRNAVANVCALASGLQRLISRISCISCNWAAGARHV